jgi:hypothetical protein
MTNQHRVVGLIMDEGTGRNIWRTRKLKQWKSRPKDAFKNSSNGHTIYSKVRTLSTTLSEIRKLNTASVGIKILTNVSTKIHNEYVLKTNTPTPIFKRTAEFLGKYNMHIRKIETTPTHSRAPWSVNTNVTLDFTLCNTTKGASTVRIRAEYTARMEQVYENHMKIFTDGSFEKDRVG